MPRLDRLTHFLKLIFAGEACSAAIYAGSLAGAYQTGLQAARDIEKVLKTENK